VAVDRALHDGAELERGVVALPSAAGKNDNGSKEGAIGGGNALGPGGSVKKRPYSGRNLADPPPRRPGLPLFAAVQHDPRDLDAGPDNGAERRSTPGQPALNRPPGGL
jgi:hypothetical protein